MIANIRSAYDASATHSAVADTPTEHAKAGEVHPDERRHAQPVDAVVGHRYRFGLASVEPAQHGGDGGMADVGGGGRDRVAHEAWDRDAQGGRGMDRWGVGDVSSYASDRQLDARGQRLAGVPGHGKLAA